MFTNEKQLGVIMCGGQSLRMRQDKGLIMQGTQSWSQLAYKKIKEAGLPSVVSINPTQREAYLQIFSADQLTEDSVAISGPLGGLLSVHARHPEYDLLILACDLVNMSVESIRYLHQSVAGQGSEYDFVVYKNQAEFAEPLVGVYTSEGLKKIYKYFLGNMLEKTSMKYILEVGNTFLLPFPRAQSELQNFNTLEV